MRVRDHDFERVYATDTQQWDFCAELSAVYVTVRLTIETIEDVDAMFEEMETAMVTKVPVQKIHFITNTEHLEVSTDPAVLERYGNNLRRVWTRFGLSLIRHGPGLRKVNLSMAASMGGVPIGQVPTLEAAIETVEQLVEKDKLFRVMQQALSKEIAEVMVSESVNLGGEIKRCTILFSDLRNFTSISESLEPGELLELLNEYFTAMTEVIEAHHGVIDKFIGDAIMTVWGTPRTNEDDDGATIDADLACRAALAMRRRLDELNAKRREEGRVEFRAGIGVNTGDVIAGIVGSPSRLNYTVLGDAVNIAARLQGATKELGADVLISDSTLEALAAKEKFTVETRGELAVRGKSQPVAVHALLAAAPG